MYHYYFKVTFGFQCLTTIRQYAMGSKRLGGHTRIREGGAGGLDSIGKSHVNMGRSRSKPPPAPDEISWFREWGGGQSISLECIRTDCLMEDQARGGE